MRKRSVVVLVWLLMVAIPVQGIAAAAMTHCGSHHHSGAGATQVDHPAAGHGDTVGHAADHEAVLDTDASGLEHDGYAKCSACAACCLGVGFPSTAVARLPVLPSVAAYCGIFASSLEVVITGPERPPRFLLV